MFMKLYSNANDAITDLHMQGFTNDFHLSGNDLLWVQEGLLVRAGEFAIVRCYKIEEAKNRMNKLVVFGVIALYHNIKGILLNHFRDYSETTPPILVKKLNELNFYGKTKPENSYLKL